MCAHPSEMGCVSATPFLFIFFSPPFSFFFVNVSFPEGEEMRWSPDKTHGQSEVTEFSFLRDLVRICDGLERDRTSFFWKSKFFLNSCLDNC